MKRIKPTKLTVATETIRALELVSDDKLARVQGGAPPPTSYFIKTCGCITL